MKRRNTKRVKKFKRKNNEEIRGNVYSQFYFAILTLMVAALFSIYFVGPEELSGISFSPPENYEFIAFSPGMISSGDNGQANLTIFDDNDLGSVFFSGDSFWFYANYSSLASGLPIQGDGESCSIDFDFSMEGGPGYDGYEIMNYNVGTGLWEFQGSFNYNGFHFFRVSCDSNTFGLIELTNDFQITNTEPRFIPESYALNIDAFEDIVLYHNFTENVTEPDLNDELTFDIVTIQGDSVVTNYPWISLDVDSGVLMINATDDSETGSYPMAIDVVDDSGDGESRTFTFNVNVVNDPPYFIGLENQSFNESDSFSYNLVVFDEEGDTPIVSDIEYLDCDFSSAPWSTRVGGVGSPDCDLFVNDPANPVIESNGDITISNFVPVTNDVGVYYLNFSAIDDRGAIYSEVFSFTVVDVNDAPILNYVCDDDLSSAVEDTLFECYVNVTDVDETTSLDFMANESWFTFEDGFGELFNPLNVLTPAPSYGANISVDFMPNDTMVGNWLINVSVGDNSGQPQKVGEKIISFFVDNVHDAPTLTTIDDFNGFTSNSYSLRINASDEDLLIPDLNVYDEDLIFSTNNTCVSVNVLGVFPGTFDLGATVDFLGSCLGSGSHDIEVTVTDSTPVGDGGPFSAMEAFTVTIGGNNAPEWDTLAETYYEIEENFLWPTLDLNNLVLSDPDGPSPFTFSYSLEPGISFNAFSLDSSGNLDVTGPSDIDVGIHIVEISVSDGIASTPLNFTFNVTNVNDPPIIESLDGNNNQPAGSIAGEPPLEPLHYVSNEDSLSEWVLRIRDEDLAVPNEQSEYFDEILILDVIIEGIPLSISFDSVEPLPPNQLIYTASFTPAKADAGQYNVTLNVTDLGGLNDFVVANLTIAEINHPPELNATDQRAALNVEWYYDLNASDIEDGFDEDGNLVYGYNLISGPSDFVSANSGSFDNVFGIFNYTFTSGDEGLYIYNITVSDTGALQDHETLYIYVDGQPQIVSPAAGSQVYNMVEGNATTFSFVGQSASGGNLTYEVLIEESSLMTFESYGTGVDAAVVDVVPRYTDETYGLVGELTLIVSVPGFPDLNDSRTWGTEIDHANAPVIFENTIPDFQVGYDAPLVLNLSEYFSDPDHFDPLYLQASNISVVGNNTNQSSINVIGDPDSWLVSFSSSGLNVEVFNVTLSDLNDSGDIWTSDVSNNFVVRFVDPNEQPQPQPTPTPSSGGGGGGSSSNNNPEPLKLILPGTQILENGTQIVLPITLENSGNVVLNNVDLSAQIYVDNVLDTQVFHAFDIDHFNSISVGQSHNVALVVDVAGAGASLYQVIINATVGSPVYSDWGEIIISTSNAQSYEERIIFTEDLIVANPECLELQELLDQSQAAQDNGDSAQAEALLDQALNSCRDFISQRSLFSRQRVADTLQSRVFLYLLIATVLAIILGIVYYVYRKVGIKRAVERLPVEQEQEIIELPR